MFARVNHGPIAVVALFFGALLSAQGQTAPPQRPAVSQVQVLISTGPRRVEVLFVGQAETEGAPDRLAPALRSALAQYGFNFSYTTDPTDLNPADLALYDALMIYDSQRLTSDQERAVLAFVDSGKGLLPIHLADTVAPASQNSAAYVALVGAGPQQRSHGTGRVFYTADGHDERAWNDPDFHTVIRNGLTWAIGPRVAAQLAALKLQPLRYTSSVVPIPNYERRAEAPRLQSALSTTEATNHIQVPPGFELQLFASEPLITGNPMAMAWDERGRLWLAESKDYPNNIQPPGQGNDVIRILEDTNHDGRADKATTFADKLTIATSLVFVNGGVVVSQARELTFLKDTNGDDRADVRETLIAGWSIRDTHALASNLKYGLDNWIWGAVGYSGFNGTVGGKRLAFNQAIYRFSRDARQMEHMANFTNNMWGLGFNETGDVFGSTANGEHSVHVAIPLPHYQSVKGLTGDGKRKLDGHYAMQVNTPKIRQVDVMGGFTAAAGHNFYTARAFPEEYWNRIAFVNEPTGRVVHRAIIERRGSGFTERDGWNVAASDDEWFAPVHAEVGPDGALWLADFYDFIIHTTRRRSGPSPRATPTPTAEATRTTPRCASTRAAASIVSRGRARRPTHRCRSARAGRPNWCWRFVTTTCSGA